MTEEEWVTSEQSRAMADVVTTLPRATPRTRRLFMAAFWITQFPGLIGTSVKADFARRVEVLEQWAETGIAPDVEYTNVFMDRDVIRAWDRTLGMSDQGGSYVTAPARQAVALREVFGNPFREVVCEPSWLTSDVLLLAKGIYDEKAFDRMPILADALQDAGCANDDVLSHCRDTSLMHVRGCWVLDLVLGKG
jgi:hypothetical protein